jgi:hypothetical protein
MERPGGFPQSQPKPLWRHPARPRPPPAAAHCRTALMRDSRTGISSACPCKELPWG